MSTRVRDQDAAKIQNQYTILASLIFNTFEVMTVAISEGYMKPCDFKKACKIPYNGTD